MSEIYTYDKLILDVLKVAEFPLSAMEIWQKAVEMGLDKKLRSISKTPDASISAKIYVNMKEEGDKSLFIKVYLQSTRFWLKEREAELSDSKKIDEAKAKEIENTKNNDDKMKFSERDLHPLLVYFLYESQDFSLLCKTIDHNSSKKSKQGINKWDHPDIVGVYFPYGNYEKDTITFLSNFQQANYKLFSFELKKTLSTSNLKESYFQAVSNSSWANEGYLVVADFNPSDYNEMLDELGRLNEISGIGVIKLDLQNPLDSQIILRAKKRELNIKTLNKLLTKNENFKGFIGDCNKQIEAWQKFKIELAYDKVFSEEEMQKYLIEKGIISEE